MSKSRGVVYQALGNLIEWYDFMLYVYLVSTFNRLFFPPGNPRFSFYLVWLIFGLSCMMRPFGSYFFGMIADKVSSRKAQNYSILLMGVASIALTVLPSFRSVGWLAAILLLLVRCLQVGCASAQFTLSIFSLADRGDQHPSGKRMVIPQLFSMIGVLFAGLVMLFGCSWLNIPSSHYWRYAYWLNVILIAVYYGLQRGVERKEPENPRTYQGSWRQVLAQWRPILLLVASMSLGFSFVYVCVVLFLPTYLSTIMHYPAGFDMKAIFYCHIIIALGLYGYSKVYDKLSAGIKNSLVVAPMLLASGYLLIAGPSTANLLFVLGVSSLLYAPYAFSIMHTMIVIFPPNIRYRCGGLAYNIGVSISSFLPMATSYFVHRFGLTGFAYFLFLVTLAALPFFLLLIRQTQPKFSAQSPGMVKCLK
jgi:MHS family proline/betaine transporter-like MFS transporter